MTAYTGHGDTAARILDLGSTLRSVVIFMIQQPFPRESTNGTFGTGAG